MKTIHMIPISPERTIAILELDLEKLTIKYRNIGKSFEIKLIEERNITFNKDTGLIHVLLPEGQPNFHFNIKSLDPVNGMIDTLFEEGILK